MCSSVAQLVEQVAVNHWVAGSSPARGAMKSYLYCFVSFCKDAMTHPSILDGISAAQNSFTHVLLDIYGVLHEGGNAFAHAIQCLERLKAAGKKVYLFSNAPRLAARIERTLEAQGVSRILYETIFSSGQHVRYCFETNDPAHTSLGKHYYHIGYPEHILLENTPSSLNLKPCNAIKDADFILLTAPFKAHDTAEQYDATLDEIRVKNLTVVCANADPYVIFKGEKLVCGGTLAENYVRKGGRVLWHGKPHTPFYKWALDQIDAPPKNVLCIGDSMWTDIKGATDAGLACALIVETSVHQAFFRETQKSFEQTLQDFLTSFSCVPTYALKRFEW